MSDSSLSVVIRWAKIICFLETTKCFSVYLLICGLFLLFFCFLLYFLIQNHVFFIIRLFPYFFNCFIQINHKTNKQNKKTTKQLYL